MNGAQSWNDLAITSPGEIRDLLADAYLNSTQATFKRSTTFLNVAWVVNNISFTGVAASSALRTDDLGMVANAAQWNFSHACVNTAASLQTPLKKIVFLRGGTDWQMSLQLAFGGVTYTDIQLSYRDNGSSGGDFTGSGQGSIPVVHFAGNFTGNVDLKMTLKQFGRFPMTLVLKDNATGQYTAFELEFNIVA